MESTGNTWCPTKAKTSDIPAVLGAETCDVLNQGQSKSEVSVVQNIIYGIPFHACKRGGFFVHVERISRVYFHQEYRILNLRGTIIERGFDAVQLCQQVLSSFVARLASETMVRTESRKRIG